MCTNTNSLYLYISHFKKNCYNTNNNDYTITIVVICVYILNATGGVFFLNAIFRLIYNNKIRLKRQLMQRTTFLVRP